MLNIVFFVFPRFYSVPRDCFFCPKDCRSVQARRMWEILFPMFWEGRFPTASLKAVLEWTIRRQSNFAEKNGPSECESITERTNRYVVIKVPKKQGLSGQNKSGFRAALSKKRQELFFAFFRFFGRNLGGSFLLDCRIEIDSDHDDVVVEYSVFVSPFLGLEVPLNSQQRAFGQLAERFDIFILAPRFHVYESGFALGFLAIFS